MLDSSVVIAAERRDHSAYEMLAAIGEQAADPEIAVSVVTVLELAHGIARAKTGEQRTARQKFLDDLLIGMPVHPVTVLVALRAGQIDALLQAAGTRIALAGLLIGTTALVLGHTVATGNTRHFENDSGACGSTVLRVADGAAAAAWSCPSVQAHAPQFWKSGRRSIQSRSSGYFRGSGVIRPDDWSATSRE